MIFNWDFFSPGDARVVDLADGRILFLPSGRSGRVFQVRTLQDGLRRERWARRIERLAALLLLAVFFSFKTAGVRYALLAIPVAALPFVSRRLLVTGLPQLHDEAALRETDRGAESLVAMYVQAPPQPENKPIVPR